MGTAAPLAIGTRGTVGSLVRKEIEYFRRLELDHSEASKKLDVGNTSSAASFQTSRANTASLGSLLSMSWRTKRSNSSSSSNSNNNK